MIPLAPTSRLLGREIHEVIVKALNLLDGVLTSKMLDMVTKALKARKLYRRKKSHGHP